jgi:hypothetical protein
MEKPDSANAKPRLPGGVCKSTGVERGMLPMILLMLIVCVLFRLRRVGIKIDFWFRFLTVRGLAVAPAGLLNIKITTGLGVATLPLGSITGKRVSCVGFKVIRGTSPL